MLCYVMLCYVMLCYVMLCYDFYNILFEIKHKLYLVSRSANPLPLKNSKCAAAGTICSLPKMRYVKWTL